MKRFHEFCLESPNETDTPVSVNTFLPQTAQLNWQVESIRQSVRAGVIGTSLASVPIAKCVPTQKTVSMPKVIRYMHANLADERPPLVMLHNGLYVIIDGHHRVCACAIDRQTSVEVQLVDSDDAPVPSPTL